MLSDDALIRLADRLTGVDGVVGVVLGGSRARGTAKPDSDVDLGLYYRPPLDTAGLRRLAGEFATGRADQGGVFELTEPGGWGPWVDGGGWLVIDGVPVDWIYRDVDRVQDCWRRVRTGRFDFHAQTGHPLGVPDFAYPGEVALGRVLADPTGELSALKEEAERYPPALAAAVVDRLDEARFLLGAVGKSADRGDVSYLAGCLFRVVCLCAHAVHAADGRWAINEKGLIDAAGRLPSAPVGFARQAHAVLARLGPEPTRLRQSVQAAGRLVDSVGDVVSSVPRPDPGVDPSART